MKYSKVYTTPRRPFEKARLDQELKLIGEYGLRNKREVWRVKYSLAKIRSAARELLTLEEKAPKRLFEGNALLRRLVSAAPCSYYSYYSCYLYYCCYSYYSCYSHYSCYAYYSCY